MKQEVAFSDLTGQMIADPEQLTQVKVLQHPELEDGPVRLDATAAELASLGKLAVVDPVIFEVTPPGDDVETIRYVASAANFGKLATQRTMAEVLGTATRVVTISMNGDKGPKVDWSAPDRAGEIHKGRVTDAEATYVRENLEAVNAHLAAAGMRQISPMNEDHRRKYGLTAPSA